jgi:hypothetical protein
LDVRVSRHFGLEVFLMSQNALFPKAQKQT